MVTEQSFSHFPAWPAPPRVRLTVLPDHDCPYLAGRVATSRALIATSMPPQLYHDFMDAGFRRSGSLIYQPICRGCRECRPIRVPVDRFRPNKSQRRCIRRNADLRISIALPKPTDEKFELYRRYMSGWHDSPRESRFDFESFLYESPVQTIEFTYRDDAGRLLAVGICDVCERSLSSVYFWFDPRQAARRLGTFGVLSEIARARSLGIRYYYLGYWVRGCRKMSYKANFCPHEILCTDGVWREPLPVGSAPMPSRR